MSLLHWVWLGLAIQPGSQIIDRILERFPDPEEFFLSGTEGIKEVGGIRERDAIRIRATTLDMAKEAIENAENYGAKIISKDMDEFPKRLLDIETCPPVLYALGDTKYLNTMPAIAIVGTRKLSDYGRKMAEIISGGLASSGVTVISGMAEGIDSEAHKACLRNGGKTVAVQGCGICNTFPAGNVELKELIAANGVVISEFAPDAEPQGSFFPIRNRLVSGMSLGVCVIEAAARSGTSITANLALEQGRKVFAVPADVLRSTSQGTFRLLKQGAIPVARASDILAEFSEQYPEIIERENTSGNRIIPSEEEIAPPAEPKKKIKKALPEGISENAAKIYKHIEHTPKFADELSEKAELTAPEAAAALTELELYGLIKPVAGRRFIIA